MKYSVQLSRFLSSSALMLLWNLAFHVQTVRLQNSPIAKQIHFCYDGKHQGFRLKSKIMRMVESTSRIACIAQCVHDPCCRSINYKKGSLNNERDCELLHELKHNTSSQLEKNEAYDHLYLLEPLKEYRSSCIPDSTEERDEKELKNYTTRISCKNVLENNSNLTNGVYDLQLNEKSEKYPVYCHMSNLQGCGSGGWTLAMKMNGHKNTFQYHSLLWSNKTTHNISSGLNGLTEEETKLASYWNTPFSKICLGMRVDGITRWSAVNYSGSSLYHVIADGVYRRTTLGRAGWKSLLVDSSLQRNCNKEGFNVVGRTRRACLRFGIFGNNEDNCFSPDSVLGFGFDVLSCVRKGRGLNGNATCGNVASWGADNGTKRTKAFGYILVQ